MKKINLIALLFSLLLSNTMFAQLEKGSFLIESTNPIGNDYPLLFGPSQRQLLGLNFFLNDRVYFNELYLTPAVGYFVNKSLVVGGQVGIFWDKNTGTSSTALSVAPKVRYYFNPNNTRMNVYTHVQPFLGFDFSNGNSETYLSYSIGAGLSSFLSPDIILNSELSFSDSDLGARDDNYIAFQIGLQAYLNPSSRKAAKSAVAGFRAGTWMLGSSTADLFLGLNGEPFNYFTILPQVGYFVAPKVMLGWGVGIERIAVKTSIGEVTNASYSVGPQLRYYFNSAKRIVWFGEADYAFNRDVNSFQGRETSSNFSTFGGKLGLNLFVSKNIAFELATGPRFRRGGDFEVGDFSLWNTHIGLNYFLGTDSGE
jgi:hypothetical protein